MRGVSIDIVRAAQTDLPRFGDNLSSSLKSALLMILASRIINHHSNFGDTRFLFFINLDHLGNTLEKSAEVFK
jgi:hypothetical protein